MKTSILAITSAICLTANATNPVLSGFNHLTRPADARMLSTGTTLLRGDLGSGSLFVSPVQRSEDPRTTFGVNFIPTMVAGQPNSMMGTGYGSSSVGNGILSGAFRYYQAGSVLARDNEGNELGTITPYVVDVSVNYSLPLTERLTMGAGLRYLYSDLFQGQDNSAKSSAINIDLAWLLALGEQSDLLIQLSELGPKMTSENGASGFAPTRFRVAYMNTTEIADRALNWSVQLEKILAPTAPILDANGAVISGRAIPTSFFAPIFTSWADAPGGMAEEFTEIRPSFGLSYEVTDALAIRSGYSYQPIDKGSLNYIGLGMSYSADKVRFDAGYALGMSALTNPMNNHIQIGIGYSL
jgi:hypothetical protein